MIGDPLAQRGAEIELGARATHQADDHQSAADREHLDVLREIGAADRVENDIDAAAPGRFEHRGREAAAELLVVQREIGAEVDAGAALLGGAGGHDGAHAFVLQELDRRGADAAPAAVNQRPVAAL